VSACVHWWLCAPIIPGQDTVPGVCRNCGETRDFVAFSPVDLFNPKTAMSAEKRGRALNNLSSKGKTAVVR
jgi:hypothetical protein